MVWSRFICKIWTVLKESVLSTAPTLPFPLSSSPVNNGGLRTQTQKPCPPSSSLVYLRMVALILGRYIGECSLVKPPISPTYCLLVQPIVTTALTLIGGWANGQFLVNCAHQASLQIWQCKMAANWQLDSHIYLRSMGIKKQISLLQIHVNHK